MRAVSAYITAMAVGISEDLRSHVAPDQLQDVVEKELEKQMLAQLVTAINERSNAMLYGSNPVTQQSAQKKVLRFMGYVNEMYNVSREVKGALMDGSQPNDVEYEVVS